MPNYQIQNYTGQEIETLLGKIENLSLATTSNPGMMSAEDKTKLNGIAEGAQKNVIESVKIDGVALTPSSKAVNIETDAAPTKDSEKLIKSKAVYSAIAKYGVISQTQTWTQQSDNSYSYTIASNTIVRGLIPKPFIDLWNTACVVNGVTYGTFNEISGYFELNGITDISYQEAQRIVITSAGLDPHLLSRWMYRFTARTNLPLFWFDPTDWSQYALNSNAAPNLGYEHKGEIILLPPSPDNNPVWILQLSNISAFVYGARHIKEIRNPFKILDNSIADTAFALAYNLEEIRIHSLKANVSFADCARLSKDSLLYMINNETSTSPIVITLHPIAKAMADADSDIQNALEIHTNITLAD